MATSQTTEGHECSLRFQVAGVERPLISVSQLARTGRRVEFAAEEGYIVNKKTGRRIRLQRAGGISILKMRARYEQGATASPSAPGFSRPRKR